MTNARIPLDLNPEQLLEHDLKFKEQNYHEMPAADRLRCQACKFFYFRLWYDRAQCLSCRRYTRLEVGEPENPKQVQLLKDETAEGVKLIQPDLRRVSWVRLSLSKQKDQRVRCLNCTRAEFTLYKSHLICRWCRTEIMLAPGLTGFWLLADQSEVKPKITSEKEALKLVSRSTIYRMIKKADGHNAKSIRHHRPARAS